MPVPSWIIGIITSLAEKLATRIGKWLVGKYNEQIKYSKTVEEIESIKDPQARAAYIAAILKR